MARESVRTRRTGTGPTGLPVSHWKQFHDVRQPGRPAARIDHVLVGPSGVHVIGYLPRPDGLDAPRAAARDDMAGAASAAAGAVADVLPARYRGAVRPMVCFRSDEPVAESSGEVLVTSLRALEHILRESPVVLSTCEVADVSTRLQAQLLPFPAAPSRTARRTADRRKLVAWAALAAAAVGAAVLGPELVDTGLVW